MIEVQGISKRYGDRLAVRDLSFTVTPGRVTGFLGPNGAGKSTTMRMILGLDRPTTGQVLIGGRSYGSLTDPLKHVGALLDASSALGARTARDHLRCLGAANGIGARRADEVLALVGLTDVARKRVNGFSLGMRQRLGIAAALLGDPEVLLLDEPVNGLDPEGIRWIRTFMRELAAEGRTVFMSSHLMSEMELTADHLIVLGRGRLLADLPMAAFRERHGTARVSVRTPETERFSALLAEAGLPVVRTEQGLEVDGDGGVVGKLALDHRVPLLELSTRTASLEEAFIAMTQQDVEYTGGTK